MTTYRLSTVEKKNAVEREFWKHKETGWTAIHETVYRWGHAYIESDAEPDVDIDNEDGFEIFDNGWELETLDDGCESNWEFPSEMTESDRRSMLEGWDNDQFCYMEENGWEMDYSEIYFYGQLELEGN